MIHSRKKCGIKIPHLMWMVIYAHPLCTYIMLNVYASYIRNFLHKSVNVFWQVRLTAELLFNIKHSSQRQLRDKQRPEPPSAGSTGLNLTTMRSMASPARRCPVSRWQAGRAPGKLV